MHLNNLSRVHIIDDNVIVNKMWADEAFVWVLVTVALALL